MKLRFKKKPVEEPVTTMSLEDLFAEADAKDAARPWWNKAWRQCRWAWERFHYQWIMKNQQRIDNKIHAGFWGPDEDGFEFYSCLGKWAVPRLKNMKKYAHGYPVSLMSEFMGEISKEENDANFERWKAMLDDMIYFFERAAGDSDINILKDQRYRRGKYLFYKYFESLWS